MSGSQALFCPLYGNQLPELRTFLGIQSPAINWNPESKLRLTRNPKSSTWNPKYTVWNPESNTIQGYLTQGDLLKDGWRLSASWCYPTNLYAKSILQYQSSPTKISHSYSTAGHSSMQKWSLWKENEARGHFCMEFFNYLYFAVGVSSIKANRCSLMAVKNSRKLSALWFIHISGYWIYSTELKVMQSPKQNMWKRYHLLIEDKRNGYLFCQKWLIKD